MRHAKLIALLIIGLSREKFGDQLEKQQEVVMNFSDIITEVFAMESAWLRSQKLASSGKTASRDVSSVYLRDAMSRIEGYARTILSTCFEGLTLRKHLSTVRNYADYEPVNSVALRRQIAARLISSERYTV